MKSKLEIIIPVIIWMYFLSEGIRGGMLFSTEQFDIGSGPPMFIKIFIYVVVPLLSFIFTLVITLKPREMPKLEHWIDQRLSAGAYKRMGKKIKFPLLGSIFFILIALVGFTNISLGNAPQQNWLILSFPGCFGIGILLGWLFAQFILTRKSA